MEKKFNLRVSARISPNSKAAVDVISFNHISLVAKGTSEHKKFQLDKIYLHSDQNEKLFENILRVPTNLMIDGFSSVVLCLGGPNSGKTYTLAGKLGYSYQEFSEPGIMVYIMRRLFTKFKQEVSLDSTYSYWVKFCFVEHDKVTSPQPSEKGSSIGSAVQIKSYSHFEEIIASVYRNNSNKRHTIIEIILQKENKLGKITTSSITFVEFGSFFYNCPYREAEELSMENDIETVLHAIKNLSKSRENQNQIFGASLLTKTLQENFLQSNSFQLIGLLDESHENNLKTLNFLQIVHQKQDRLLIKNFREQIKREEVYLKNLFEKHRKVLNLLSRCIGMELGYLQKQKKTRNFEGPIFNTFYKTCEKIKYANVKKLQNERFIEQIRKLIEQEKGQLAQIEAEYEEKNNAVRAKQKLLKIKQQSLEVAFQELVAPSIKFSNVDNSLYWKYEDTDAIGPNKNSLEEENMDSERDSRNDARSMGIFPTSQMITSHKNLMKMESMNKEVVDKYDRDNEKQNILLNEKKINALKSEIFRMFGVISQQEKYIEEEAAKLPSHFHILTNRVKNRHKNAKFNKRIVDKCIRSLPSDDSVESYFHVLESNQIHQKVEREFQMAALTSGNLISTKSLRSEKQIKN